MKTRKSRPPVNRRLAAAADQARKTEKAVLARDQLLYEAWKAGSSLREIAGATGLSHMAVKRVIDRIVSEQPKESSTVRDTWSQYRSRYGSRPETFDAYVDVWKNVTKARQSFTGWASFSQAANAEPAQSGDRVTAAEEAMRLGGYELGPATARGARRWVKR